MKAFREAVEARDPDALEALLADDVVFHSPAAHQPYEGKAATAVLLRAVMRVFEDFRYTREIGAEGAADQVLVFEARIGTRRLEGADFLHVREDGLIDDFRVMVRPLSGLHALAEAMGEMVPRVMREQGLG